MADSKSLKEQAQEAGELFKKVTSEAGEAFKNSNAGKEVLGDDGKFGKEDVEHLKKMQLLDSRRQRQRLLVKMGNSVRMTKHV